MHQVAECCRLGWLVSELTLWWKMTIRWRQQWYLFRRFAEQLPTVQTQFLEKVSFGNESCKAQSDRSCRLAKSRWAARPLQHNPMQWLFKLHIGNCRNSIFTFCWRAFFAWYAAVLRGKLQTHLTIWTQYLSTFRRSSSAAFNRSSIVLPESWVILRARGMGPSVNVGRTRTEGLLLRSFVHFLIVLMSTQDNIDFSCGLPCG